MGSPLRSKGGRVEFFYFAYIYDILLSDETRNSLQKYLA